MKTLRRTLAMPFVWLSGLLISLGIFAMVLALLAKKVGDRVWGAA